MKPSLLIAAFFVAAFLFGLPPVRADDEGDYGPDWPLCRDLRADPHAEIDACNRLLAGGKLTQQHTSWAYNDRGAAWGHLNRYDLAEKDFVKSEQLDPTNKQPYGNLAALMNAEGRYNEALGQADKLIAFADMANIHCQRGRALAGLYRYYEAIGAFNDEFARDADNQCAVPFFFDLTRFTRTDLAIAMLDHAVAANPQDGFAFHDRGLIYMDQHQYEHAISDLTIAVGLNPYNQRALAALGGAYAKLGNFDIGFKALDRAVMVAPDDWFPYQERAIVYFVHGDYQKAIDDCERSLEMQPTFAQCKQVQLRSQLMLGNFRAAADRAAALSDRADTYGIYRGAAEFASGDMSDASAEFLTYTQAAPDDPYGWLWLYLADRNQGKDDTAMLRDMARRHDAWPNVVLRYIVGTATEDAVFAAADVPDPDIKHVRTAEANFYLGELAALGGDKANAAKLFKASVAIGHAAADNPMLAIPVYKIDDDIEIALANAALHGQGPGQGL